MTRTIVMDLDGTICKIKGPKEEYRDVEPIKDVVKQMWKAHSQGDTIIIHTARGMRTYSNDTEAIREEVMPQIEEWLKANAVPWDILVVGKPWAGPVGFYVDDRCMTPQEFVNWTPSTLIVTLGGRSSRFPTLKYMEEVDGTIMLDKAVRSLDLRFFDSIIFAVVREHEEKYHVSEAIFKLFGPHVSIFLLDGFTSSQSETVATVVRTLDIHGQITVRDCDNLIQVHQIPKGNSVCGYELRYNENIHKHDNKSFIMHIFDTAYGIREKSPTVDATISCGVYTFEDAQEFLRYYDKAEHDGELYLSMIIQDMMDDGRHFGYYQTPIFHDWGTSESFERYKDSVSRYRKEMKG